jgi:elongation factor G
VGPGGHGLVVRATVPQAEMHLYATDLNSRTQGRASFSRKFRGYEEVPPEVASKVIAEAEKEPEMVEV